MEKPKYKVPTMKEINELEWNGCNVVSTFSGGGGSCLGYRMAGYHVVYANEFVEEAQKTYRANNPNCFLDTRDIRTVTPESILEKINMNVGELDLFDGSPPCSAFSTAGQREKGWGSQKNYSDGKVQRVDDLFFEYTRLLKGLQPKVFIAENVSGLIKGKAKGYFNNIIKELRSCGYEVKASLLSAMWLGVPQNRQRVIFMGVRKDLGMQPVYPKPFDYYYTLADAFEGVKNDKKQVEYLKEMAQKYAWGEVLKKLTRNPKKATQGSKVMNGSYFNLVRESMYQPCSTICQMNGSEPASGNCHPLEDRKLTIPELKRITSIPDDFILTGDYRQQWERLGRMVPPVMMKNISKTVYEEVLCKIK
jgi:DNA (cytosine-5)-methyltransferase 1